VTVGVALIGSTLFGTIGVSGRIGAAPLATGLRGWCPAYSRIVCEIRGGELLVLVVRAGHSHDVYR